MNVEIGTETPIFLFWEYLYFGFAVWAFTTENGNNAIVSGLGKKSEYIGTI
jgi:hypothetical protein